MKYYKIITIGLLLADNTVHPGKEIIREDQLINAVTSLAEGFIVEATAEEIAAAFPPPPAPVDPPAPEPAPEAAPAVESPAVEETAAPAEAAAPGPDPADILKKAKK